MCHYYPWASPDRLSCLTEPQMYALSSQIPGLLEEAGESVAAPLMPLFAGGAGLTRKRP